MAQALAFAAAGKVKANIGLHRAGCHQQRVALLGARRRRAPSSAGLCRQLSVCGTATARVIFLPARRVIGRC